MKRNLSLVVLVVLALPLFQHLRESVVSAQRTGAEPMEVILYFVDPDRDPIRGRLLYFDEARGLYLIESADGSRHSVPWAQTRRVVPFPPQGEAAGQSATPPIMVTVYFRDSLRSPIIGRLLGFEERTLEFLFEEADGSIQRVPWDQMARIVPLARVDASPTRLLPAEDELPESVDGGFTVTSLEDSGPGSLREALLAANHESGPNHITFAVSGTISPASPLPALSDKTGGTTIDGRGIVTLDGASMRTQSSGLAIHSANNVIAGLTITRFPLDGVQIRGPGASGNEIVRCRIGIDGHNGRGNRRHGVLVSGGATGNRIGSVNGSDRNVISDNTASGIVLSGKGTTENLVAGNYIGTDITGSAALGNKKDGVAILAGASGNSVGGPEPAARNVISGSGQNGVLIHGEGTRENVVVGNYIGVDISGASSLGNGWEGVNIMAGAAHNVIGGTIEGSRNIISGNKQNGVLIHLEGTVENLVQGNYIGTDATGTIKVPNFDGVQIREGAAKNMVGGTTPEARNLISGNTRNGVDLTDPGTIQNRVAGNYIGTDFSGTKALGNEADGVNVNNASSNNRIGGTEPGAGNVISGNALVGILIGDSKTTRNVVTGNYIGIDATGTITVGNKEDGISIQAGASENTIGGTAEGARNVISGNGWKGIRLSSAGTTGNTVLGNFIGTDLNGTAALGNEEDGILIDTQASNNVIGGTENGARNIISGNGWTGVTIRHGETSENVVLGNYIGTDVTGATALGNNQDGVGLDDGASDNTVGGTTEASKNIISGNYHTGIRLIGAHSNTVHGNYIGTDITGVVALPNQVGVGLYDGAFDNTVGGTTEAARNVISGNTLTGVQLSGARDNTVHGNYIGTDITGVVALPNLTGVGLHDGAINNTVGGTTEAERNVIAGNTIGVVIDGLEVKHNYIQGNYIGVDATGTAAMGNAVFGILVQGGASFNTIGGMEEGAGNIISGNGDPNHVRVVEGRVFRGATAGIMLYIAHGNTIQGNLVGTDTTGTKALGNATMGIGISGGATANIIGGTEDGARNVVSGNAGIGVSISFRGTERNVIFGNYIGTDVTGTMELGNTGAGVGIGLGASGNTLGGTQEGAGNVISGNFGAGVAIGRTASYESAGTANNVIRGNLIGTNAAGSGPLGNRGHGIELVATRENVVGGTALGARNTIAWNAGDGVSLADPEREGSAGNQIRGNAIHSNEGMGIKLSDGANNALPAPAIQGISPVAGSAPPNSRVELFVDGGDEGAILVGTANTDGEGVFSASIDLEDYAGKNLTATATDSSGNTSEFSVPVRIGAGQDEAG